MLHVFGMERRGRHDKHKPAIAHSMIHTSKYIALVTGHVTAKWNPYMCVIERGITITHHQGTKGIIRNNKLKTHLKHVCKVAEVPTKESWSGFLPSKAGCPAAHGNFCALLQKSLSPCCPQKPNIETFHCPGPASHSARHRSC